MSESLPPPDSREKLEEIVHSAGSSLDRRFDRWEVSLRWEGDRPLLEGETTSRPTWEACVAALRREGREPIDRIRVLPEPGEEPGIVQSVVSVTHLRESPNHRSELLTQIVMGETMEEIDCSGGWVLGRVPDGYLGWVDEATVVRPPDDIRRSWSNFPLLCVTSAEVAVRSLPKQDAPVLRDAVFDSRLLVRSRKGGWVQVEMPDGVIGWVPEKGGVLEQEKPRYPSREAVVAVAKRLLGAPYLWGGTSPKGFDCSGLVQRVFHHFGVFLPRDADLQWKAAEALPGPARKPGDLLFFGKEKADHVAISVGGADFIHASGWVRLESLNSRSPSYRGDLREKYLGVGRIGLLGAPGPGDGEKEEWGE